MPKPTEYAGNAKETWKNSGIMQCPWLITKIQRERFGEVMGMAEYPFCKKIQARPVIEICKRCSYRHELDDYDELPCPIELPLVRSARTIGKADSFRRHE